MYCELSDDSGNEFQKSGGAENTYCGHQSDQGGHDFDYREKTAPGTFDKSVVNIYFVGKPTDNNGNNKERNDKI